MSNICLKPKLKIKYFNVIIVLILVISTFVPCTQTTNKKDFTSTPLIKTPVYTSKSFIELVKKDISEGQENDIFNKYSIGKTLNSKLLSKIQINRECREYLNNVINENKEFGESSINLVDIDNDNIDEIVVYEYSGGSGGFAYISVLKKDKSGVYQFSEYPDCENIFSIIWSKHAFIRYEGIDYYIDKEWNYATHVFEGINIYSFDNGKIIEHTFVGKYSDKFTLITKFISNKEYNELKNRIYSEANKALLNLNESNIYYGNAEKEIPDEIVKKIKDNPCLVEKWTEADINNDEIQEFIGKGLDLPSSMGYARYLHLIVFSRSGNKFKEIDLQKKYNIELYNDKFSAQGFWVDKYLGRMYVNILIQNANENIYEIKTFLLKKSKVEKIIAIKAESIKQVNSETWTEGINIKFKHATKYEHGI